MSSTYTIFIAIIIILVILYISHTISKHTFYGERSGSPPNFAKNYIRKMLNNNYYSGSKINQNFQEYFQQLLRERVSLFRLLEIWIISKKSKCADYKLSQKDIIKKLYDNSRYIADSFIPFFNIKILTTKYSGVKDIINLDVFKLRWPTPYPPFKLNTSGYIPTNEININKNIKVQPEFQNIMTSLLQTNVDLIIDIIINNRISSVNIQNNIKNIVNLLAQYTKLNMDNLETNLVIYNDSIIKDIVLIKKIINTCDNPNQILNVLWVDLEFNNGDKCCGGKINAKYDSVLCNSLLIKIKESYEDMVNASVSLSDSINIG